MLPADDSGQVDDSISDGRDYGLGDQVFGVASFLGVAGDDGYQVKVGDDVDKLAAAAARGEAAVLTFGVDPPMPAIPVVEVGWGALWRGGGGHVGGRDRAGCRPIGRP